MNPRSKKSWRQTDANGESIGLLPLVVIIMMLVVMQNQRDSEFRLRVGNDTDEYITVMVYFDGVEVVNTVLSPKGTDYYDIFHDVEKYEFKDFNGVTVTTQFSLSDITFEMPGTWGLGDYVKITYLSSSTVSFEGD